MCAASLAISSDYVNTNYIIFFVVLLCYMLSFVETELIMVGTRSECGVTHLHTAGCEGAATL